MGVRIALTFSAFFALAVSALAGPYSDLEHSLESAKNAEDRNRILQDSPLIQNDQKLNDLIANSPTVDANAEQEQLEEAVAIRARAEANPPPSADLHGIAADIKQSPVYTDRGDRESTNWLGRAIQRLRNLKFNTPKADMPDMPSGIFGPWVTYLAWIVLGAALITFVVFGLKRIDFASLRRAKKSSGLLEDDDPDRTLDEWLILADQLESEGRYREAVRSLYLACLLKIDEARIARFDRGQTNWEHLARIESSPRRPAELEFRKPTQAFDRIWYGYQVQGAEDVARFRQWYREIVDATRKVAA